jgi:hypothetical protein
MATSAYANTNQALYSKVDKASAIAFVLLRTAKPGQPGGPYIRDVSGVLYELKQVGFRLKNLGLRAIPGGYYSEDVEMFLGHLLSMGYATQRSPIKLTAEGELFCREILDEEANANRTELADLERAVDQVLARAAPL